LHISTRYIYSIRPGVVNHPAYWPRTGGRARWLREVTRIPSHEVELPKDVYDALQAVAFATDEEVVDHVVRALRGYLAEDGHRAAVSGFATRAQMRYRPAFDRLSDP